MRSKVQVLAWGYRIQCRGAASSLGLGRSLQEIDLLNEACSDCRIRLVSCREHQLAKAARLREMLGTS